MKEIDKKWNKIVEFINSKDRYNNYWECIRDEFINAFVNQSPKDFCDCLTVQCELLENQNNQDMDGIIDIINDMENEINEINNTWYRKGILNEDRKKQVAKIEDKSILKLMKKLSALKRGTDKPEEITFITSLEVMTLGMLFNTNKKDKYAAIIKGLLGKK